MRIQRLDIDGFGIWTHESFILTPNLNVFLGPNEAGKSTLLNFIRAVLFGFERRGQPARYEPAGGHIHGGRIQIVHDNQEFVIQRLGGSSQPSAGRVSIIDSSGKRFGEETLQKLLGGVTKELFCSVFAFGLTELEQLNSLNRTDVNGIIFSAGVDTPVPVTKVEESLKKEADALFRKSGSTSVINQGLKKLEELQQEIVSLRKLPEKYQEALRERKSLLRVIDENTSQLADVRSQLTWLRTLLSAWSVWQQWRQIQAELTELPPVDDFPPQGVARLGELKRRIAENSASLEYQEEQLHNIEKALSEVPFGPVLVEYRSELLDLIDRRPSFLHAVERLQEQVGVISECKKAVEQKLLALGTNWTVEKVQGVEGGLELKETARAVGQQLREQQELWRNSQIRLEQITEKVNEYMETSQSLKTKIQHIRAKLNESSYDYNKRYQALMEYREMRDEIRVLVEANKHLEQYIVNLRGQLDNLSTDEKSGAHSVWLLNGLAVLGILAGVVAALFGKFNRSLGITLGAVGATLALVSLGMRAVYEMQVRKVAKTVQVSRKRLENEIRNKEEEFEKNKRRMNQLQQDAALAASICFGNSEPKDEEIFAVERALQEEKGLQITLNALEKEMERVEEQLKQAEFSREQLETKMTEAYEQVQYTQQKWQKWLVGHGLIAELTPEGALEVIDAVLDAQEAVRKWKQAQDIKAKIQDNVTYYCDRVNRLLRLCGQSAVEQHLAARAILDLKASLEQYEILVMERNQRQEAVAVVKNQCESARKELKRLLEAAGAQDFDDFHHRAEVYAQRRELQRKLRELTIDLTSRSGERGLDAICQALQSNSEQMLKEKISALKAEETALEDAMAKNQMRVGEINQLIADLEQDQRCNTLQFNYQTLQEEMNTALLRWIKLMLAKELVTITRQRYEKNRQPEVLYQASVYFAKMTEGRYRRVFAPFGEQVIRVETAERRHLTVEQLSRGTVEQLYLAMRFALIREFARRSTLLPIIMDDILVNFDPVRLEHTAAVIRELAEEHQILFFTCHPHIVQALKGTSNRCSVLNLGMSVA